MKHRWFSAARYHSSIVFLVAGVFAALFSWNSLSLATVAMANVRFLQEHGAMAVMEGGLVQLLEVIVKGYVSLAFYIGFKACEVELLYRWRASSQG